MLKHRIIPILLYGDGFCLQTTQFKRPARKIGPMEQYVTNMANRNVDELMILDIYATARYEPIKFSKIKAMTQGQFCPVTYGGGIRDLDDISKLINDCGVDKVVIKTHDKIIYNAARKFGSQAIVFAMDCYPHHSNGTYFVHDRYKSTSPYRLAQVMQKEGAGEILLTGMHKQGLMERYSYNLIQDVAPEVNIPVVANGGCGEPAHMVEAIKAGASAVAASSMFALRGVTPQDCARALQAAGLPARVAQEPPK